MLQLVRFDIQRKKKMTAFYHFLSSQVLLEVVIELRKPEIIAISDVFSMWFLFNEKQ